MAEAGVLGEAIIVRFDGLDAAHHELELTTLAESLNGLSMIIAASAHFALTGEGAIRKDHQRIKVLARPPRDGCFIVETIVNWAGRSSLFKDYAVQVLAPLTVGVVTYVFTHAAGKREEMKLIHASLETAIRELGSQHHKTVEELSATIETLATRLAPATRRAVAPIGKSARTLKIARPSGEGGVVLDEADKDAIESSANITVGDERWYTVLISELDMETGACHVDVDGDDAVGRHSARVTDPVVMLPNNPYVSAMASKQPLRVRAKATIKDGGIDRLYISDCEGKSRGEPDFKLR